MKKESWVCALLTKKAKACNSREEVCLYAAFVGKKIRLLLVEGRMH